MPKRRRQEAAAPSEVRDAAREFIEFLFVSTYDSAQRIQYGRGGEAVVVHHVVPDRKTEFERAVSDLQKMGCDRDVLFRRLFTLRSVDQDDLDRAIPHKEEVDSLVASLKNVVGKMRRLERSMIAAGIRAVSYGLDMNGLRNGVTFDDLGHEEEQFCWIINKLNWYADLLTSKWQRPQKRLLKMYARLACCIYPLVATGRFQDRVVARLLNSFENADDTNSVRSLEINRQTVQESHPAVYRFVEEQLKAEHTEANKT